MVLNYYNITFDGQVLEQNALVIPLPEGAKVQAGASITSIQQIDRKGSFMVKVHCRFDSGGYSSSFHFNEGTRAVEIAEKLTRSEEHVKTACWKNSLYQAEEVHSLGGSNGGRNTMRLSLRHMSTG